MPMKKYDRIFLLISSTMNATYRVKQEKSPRLSKMSVVILSFALILLTSHYGLVNADAK